MGYAWSRIVFQLLCVGTLVMSVSNGCQLYTISDQCQQGWYQVEHKCILLPNKMARKQVAASDGCKHLGGNLLSDPISDQVKECILRKSSTEIWIDNVGGKPQQCGIMNLTSQRIIRVRCNQTMTTPRSYVCESNSSSATYTATLENIITQTSTSDIGFPTLSTKVTPRPAVSYTTSGTNNTNLTSTDQAHTDMNTNGPVAWTTPLGSPTTATTGAEDIRPSTAEVPIFPNQTEFGNEPTKQKEAGKGLLETASTGILCPPGFDWIHQACYKFVQDELDWDKAFTYCKASNGDLSKIISPREKDNIQKYLASRYPSIQSWWMGFKGESTTEWAWLDGTAVDPNMIPWNNPYLGTLKRELCGTIETKDAKLQISGSICSTAKPFICEYHAMTPRHEVSSTTLAVPIQDSGANIDMSSITTLYREEMEVTTEVSTPRHEVSFTSTEMPFQEFGPNTDRDSDTTLTDMDSDTTLNREQTEVSTEASMTADWIATTTSTATPRADDKAPTTSEVPSTPKQTVLLKELTKDTGGVGATSLPEQKKDPRMDGERSESPATSAVPFTSTTSGNLLTTSNGEHVIDREGNHTQNSSTGAGMVKPRPADVLTRKSIGTAAPPRQPLPTSSDGVDQAHTYLSENGSSAWTTSFGSTITSTTGSEDSGPPAAEVPNFTKQADLLNEPTKETGAEKGDPKIQDDLNNITTNYTDQTQTDERPSSSFHWTTTMDTVVDPKIQDDLNNITTHYTLQTQTDERASSSFHWTTTMDTVATPRPKNCPRDVKVRSMGQDSVTFMWRHQAQYDDTEFRIAVFDNASNRISAPNSPQVSDGAYTYISVTSLDHTTDYRFKIESTLSNVTEYVCDDELPKIVFCPEDSQEEVTFVQTRGGVTRQVPCPPNYEGNITRTCNHKTGSWTPFSQYNCARKRLIIASNLANDLSNESSEVLKARVKDISSEVTSALEGNITIVSGEIKQIVNILEQIGIASNRSSVSNDTLQRLAAITDKLIEADTSTWDELSSANKTENAGSVLLKAMEDITSSYLHSANVTDTLIQEKNIVITVASTGQGRDNITFPKMDQATYNTNQTLNKVFLSSEALSGSVAYSVIIYMNVSDKFKVHSSSNESSQEQRIGTDVISFSLSSKSTSLSSPLILTFKTGESRDGAVCSFLDTKNEISGVWLSDGCKTILKETTIDCQCSHLTNFAVLMSMTRLSPDHHTILSYISVIGLSISLFFLCLTVTVYSVMWRYVKSDKSVLHINLCVCLMLGYTVFLGGISRTEHRVACAVAAALLHYLFLAVFFVMLSQGLLILKSVTSVSSVSILRYLYIIMYGAPLVIVATSLGITQGEGFGTDKACWLSPQKGVLWAFVGPALSIVVVNFFILFAVIRIMQKSRIMTDKDVKKKTKSVVRSIFILSPILGVTWVLGVLSATMELAIFQYAFAISNSLQGLFIFIFQCVLQYQIKDGFRALLRRYRATSFDSSQRMVSTGQSQEKGYSESGQKTTSITNTSGSYMSKE